MPECRFVSLPTKMHCSKERLFDHLVGVGDQSRQNGYLDRSGAFLFALRPEQVQQTVEPSEHRVVVGGILWDLLHDIPVLHHLAVHHHELDVLSGPDVLERIAFHD